MLISELARRTGSSTRALRHYDRQGLLASRRRPNGYREFDEDAVEQVRRIRLLLSLGLDLRTAARLLPCFSDDGALTGCPAARRRLTSRAVELDGAIAELERLRSLVAATLSDLTP